MPDKPTPAPAQMTLLSDQDLYLFNEGSNYRLHETMGAHLVSRPAAGDHDRIRFAQPAGMLP